MSNPIKARILGALVLVSLAIIFLPWVFDGTGVKERQQLDIGLPPAPEVSAIELVEPTREDLRPPEPVIAEVVEPEPSSEAAPKPAQTVVAKQPATPSKPERKLSLEVEKPVLDKEGVPVAWTLQLASFKDAANAANLRAQLLQKGYKAYIRQRDDLHKVFVGPDIQRSEIEKLRGELKQEFKLDGLILRFSTH